MAETPTFRGYWAIREVVERLWPLADWTRQFKPNQRHLTIRRKDYDLIMRWPKAAHVNQIEVMNGEAWYHGLELTYDGGPRRYQPPAQPQQVDVEELCQGEGAYSP
jgi:hypothetical protein